MLSVVSAAATGVRTGHALVAVAYLIAFVLLADAVGRVGVKKGTDRDDTSGRARSNRLGYGGDVARIPGMAETRTAARSGKG